MKQLGRDGDTKKLRTAEAKDRNPFKGMDIESELKPVAKVMFRGYLGLEKHIRSKTIPEIHPMFDEELFFKAAEKEGWTPRQIAGRKTGFITAVNLRESGFKIGSEELCKNQLTRLAVMISFMFTGINYTPLLTMRRRDVKFKQVGGNRFLFETIKKRANGKDQDNAIGFSKRAKEFVESWLAASSLITGDDSNAWLFPYIRKDGSVGNFINSNSQAQVQVNKYLKSMGLARINSSVLRQTKLDTLMKVTEDIYLVSLSANNSVTTIKRHYSVGLEQDHERNLSASMDAKYAMASGVNLKEAVTQAKYKFHDILSEYDYRKLRKNSSYTPLGVRCEGNKNTKDSVSRELQNLNLDMPIEEQKCTNFLGCFECKSHVLVAAVNDIWLMLSFFDVIAELKAAPAFNSLPKDEFHKLENTIISILDRFKEKSKTNYQLAVEKNNVNPHPLYSDIRSLNDLLEVF